MERTVKIVIPGEPQTQLRMRHRSVGKFTMTYDPKAKEKKHIRALIKDQQATFEYPRITFLFHMPIPKSILKRDKELYHSGTLKHDKKPDVDNLIKLYLDCLDGIALQGDQKVSLGPCIKVYHPEPKTIIWIHETTHKLQAFELDSAFVDPSECGIPSSFETDYLLDSYTLFHQARSQFLDSSIPPCAIQPLTPRFASLPHAG
jgi:Holliday junction resolvase RusA-like endonuclease